MFPGLQWGNLPPEVQVSVVSCLPLLQGLVLTTTCRTLTTQCAGQQATTLLRNACKLKTPQRKLALKVVTILRWHMLWKRMPQAVASSQYSLSFVIACFRQEWTTALADAD